MILSQKLNVFELIVFDGSRLDEIKQITYVGNKLIELCAIEYQCCYTMTVRMVDERDSFM